MADKQESVSDAAEQAQEQGYIGEVHDEIENDAYTVQGQGPETAKREREQRGKLRSKFESASRDEGEDDSSSEPAQQPAQQPTTSKPSKSTGSGSGQTASS